MMSDLCHPSDFPHTKVEKISCDRNKMEQKVEGDVNGKIPNAFLNLPIPRSLFGHIPVSHHNSPSRDTEVVRLY